MNLKNYLNKDSLHHAYILYGNHSGLSDALNVYLEKDLSFSVHGNPDYYIVDEDVLTISTVRSVVESSSRKPLNGKKIYVIKSRVLTRESQNALLKIVEEPNQNTHFFFLLDNKGSILPTLLSRVVELDMSEQDAIHTDTIDFINSSLKDRLKMVEVITKDKDRKRASQLINGLLRERSRVKMNGATIKALELGSRYIDLASSSVKMLLENIALTFEKK
jgi:DNA polymerase III delta prime subunit